MARGVSLLFAVATTLVLMVAPFLLVRHMGGSEHDAVALLATGAMLAFVHGLGFVPRNAWLRSLASPWIAWPLLGLGAGWLIVIRYGV